MFFFSMLEDDPGGLNGSCQSREGDSDGLEEGGDISLYGVDWEDMEDELLMMHHHQHNPILLSNLFSSAPSILSEVECTPLQIVHSQQRASISSVIISPKR